MSRYCILFLLVCVQTLSFGLLHGNDTEVLAFQALEAGNSMPSLRQFLVNQVNVNVQVSAVPHLFAQQHGVEPVDGSLQLKNFGALHTWENIHRILQQTPHQRLLILIRHGQAWENLNPGSNSNCEFTLNGSVIQNFDSPLTPEGQAQAQSLNSLLRSPAAGTSSTANSTISWFETLGLTQENTTYITSPLSRTLQTTERVFDSLPLVDTGASGSAFVAHELIRATVGTDVCNFRHSVKTPTDTNPLPPPWATGCQIPSDSLESLFSNAAQVKFTFPIRPPGGTGFGLVSDYDELWRSDSKDDMVIATRAKAFLAQLRDSTADGSVVAVVTHGEMVSAIYEAAGEQPYSPKNTEVVPLLIKFG